MNYTVYVLSLSECFNEIDNNTFYIGITMGSLKSRLNMHLSKRNFTTTGEVLREVYNNDIKIHIHPILENTTQDKAVEVEKELINKYSTSIGLINIFHNLTYCKISGHYIHKDDNNSFRIKLIKDKIQIK